MRADYAERGRRLLYVKSSFHVFLSHSSGDKPAAEELGRRLLKEGIGGDDNVMQAQQFLQTALKLCGTISWSRQTEPHRCRQAGFTKPGSFRLVTAQTYRWAVNLFVSSLPPCAGLTLFMQVGEMILKQFRAYVARRGICKRILFEQLQDRTRTLQ
jgi:hypothetical protein